MKTPEPEALTKDDITIVHACALFVLLSYSDESGPALDVVGAVLHKYGLQAMFYMMSAAIRTLDGGEYGTVELTVVDNDGNPIDVDSMQPEHRLACQVIAAVLAGDYDAAFALFSAPGRAGEPSKAAQVFHYVMRVAGRRLGSLDPSKSTLIKDAGYLLTTEPDAFKRLLAGEQSTKDK